MRHLSLATRSRTILLVVIGVLLAPTIALGARLVSGWRSGSVVVKRLGPLSAVSWVPTVDEWNPGWNRFETLQNLTIPPVNMNGTIASDVIWRTSIVIPQSLVDRFAEVVNAYPEDAHCYVTASRGVLQGVYDDPWDEFRYAESQYDTGLARVEVRSAADLVGLAGPHTMSARSFVWPQVEIAEDLPDGKIYTSVGCDYPIDPWTAPLEIRIESLRVLGL